MASSRLAKLSDPPQWKSPAPCAGTTSAFSGSGAAVKRDGVVEPILRIGHVAGIEEGSRVSGMRDKPGIESGFRSLPVGAGDCRFGGRNFVRNLLGRFRLGMRG